jgi:hypothetical protein
LRNNVPMTSNPEASKLLGRAIKGDHPRRREQVLITEQRGGGIKVTELDKNGKPVVSGPVKDAKALDDVDAPTASKVDPRQVEKEAVTRAADKPAGSERQHRARALMDVIQDDSLPTPKARQLAAQELQEMKKKAKVSWEKLGISDQEVIELTEWANKDLSSPKPAENRLATVDKIVKKAKPISKEEKKPVIIPDTPSRKSRIEAALANMKYESLPLAERQKAAQELLDIRKASKKTWDALGFANVSDDDLRAFVELKEEPKAPEAPAPTNGRQAHARGLFKDKKWNALADYKAKAKVSWAALGFTDAEVETIQKHRS